MWKFHQKNSQNAQGMVEFALVLPVLLLLILGIIAFGHLFFVYSFTVAASREAARWGAASGVTANGIPRYRDCDEIRETAVRVGGVAGVSADNIVIEYDRGPDTTVYATCPVGGQGPDVTLSDRIVVTVNVDYSTIVPLVEIPDVPISAETARTVIRSLPVGSAPPVSSTCTQTLITIVSNSDPLDMGATESFHYEVTAADGSTPVGRVTIQVEGVNVVSGSTAMSGDFTHVFTTFGEVLIYASFESTDPTYCEIDPPVEFTVNVRRASVVRILSDTPDPSAPDEGVTVQVIVEPKVGVSATAPTGMVSVYDLDKPTVGCQITTLDSNGKGSCTIPGFGTATGARKLVAIYQGDTIFAPSDLSVPAPHSVVGVVPPTLIPTSTAKPLPTPAPVCPVLVTSMNFASQADAFWVSFRNSDTTPVSLYKLTVGWPKKGGGDASLKEVRFDTNTTGVPYPCNAASPVQACIWVGNPLPPTSQILGPSPNIWSGVPNLNLAPGETKQMRFVFNNSLPNANKQYSLTIEFDKFVNGERCTINLQNVSRP